MTYRVKFLFGQGKVGREHVKEPQSDALIDRLLASQAEFEHFVCSHRSKDGFDGAHHSLGGERQLAGKGRLVFRERLAMEGFHNGDKLGSVLRIVRSGVPLVFKLKLTKSREAGLDQRCLAAWL